jgi:hypothetical protein
VTCFTGIAIIAVHNASGSLRRKPMGKPQRFLTWLTVDVTVIAISMIIIAVGVWIGFEGPSFP